MTQPTYEELALTLARVAAIAHDGGLDGLSESGALSVIRLLTSRFWDGAGTNDDRQRRVVWAITKAQSSTRPASQFWRSNPPLHRR